MCKQVWVAFCNAQKHGTCVHVSLKAFPYCACLKVTCSIHFPLSQLRSLLKNLERVTPYCHTSIPPRLDGALYTRIYYRRLSVSLSLIGGGLDRWAGGVQEGGVRNCDRLWQTEEEMEGEKWRERGLNEERRSLLMCVTLLWDRCPSRTSSTLIHTHIIPRVLVSVAEALACCSKSDRITLYHQEWKRRKKQCAGGGWQFDSSACYFHSWVHAVHTHKQTNHFTYIHTDRCAELQDHRHM